MKGGSGSGGGANSGGSQSQLIKIADAVNGATNASTQPFIPKRVSESSAGTGSASGGSLTGSSGAPAAAKKQNSPASAQKNTPTPSVHTENSTSAGTLRRNGNGAKDGGIPSESANATGAARDGSKSASGTSVSVNATTSNRTTAEAAAGNHGATKDDATSAGSIIQDTNRATEVQPTLQPTAPTTPPQQPPATPNSIPLPDVPDAEKENGDSTPLTSQTAAQSKYAPLLGYWRQVDPTQHEPDFAPGGFDQSILAIRPTQRSMQIYRSWGTPAQLVIAAELRATFDLNSGVVMTENPSTPCRFSPTVLELPLQANQAKKQVIPPTHALPYNAQWSVENNDTLLMDGKLYQRMDRSEFEAVAQSKPVITASSNSSAKGSTSSSTQKQSDTPAGGVDFFGTRVRGKYVCFVCDISGSMDGDKLIALRAELTRTIQGLPNGSHFEVIFFSNDAFLLEPDWVMAGTPKARDFMIKIQNVGAGGGTDPTNALNYSFTKLNPIPHELFLLTDGHFGVDPTGILQKYNSGADQTRIHTIGLGQDVDASLLEEIAKKYGGQYRAIAAQAAPPPMPNLPNIPNIPKQKP